MDIEGIATLFVLLLHWRVLACSTLAGVAAYLLVSTLPWFSPAQGILITCVGVTVGICWQSMAETTRQVGRGISAPQVPTAPSTVVAAAGTFGALWGAACSANVHSFAAGVLVLAVVAWLWLGSLWRALPNFHRGHARLSTVVAGLIYPIVAALCHHAA